MAVIDDGVEAGKKPAWLEDRKQRDYFRAIDDGTFYQEHPELKPFDNGEGFWTAGLNRDVEMQEFVKCGRQILKQNGKSNFNEEEAFKKAADRLLKILEWKGTDFARIYINNVLERPVAAKLLQTGGSQFYTSCLARPFSTKGYPDGATNFAGWGDHRSCSDYNQVSLDALGRFTFSVSHDTFFYPAWVDKPVDACRVQTTMLDLNRETSPGRFQGRIEDAYFARTETGEKLYEELQHQGEIPSWHTGEGIDHLLAAFFMGGWDIADSFYDHILGANAEKMDTLWRAGILAHYLSIKASR